MCVCVCVEANVMCVIINYTKEKEGAIKWSMGTKNLSLWEVILAARWGVGINNTKKIK